MASDFAASYEVELHASPSPELIPIVFQPPSPSAGPGLSLLIHPAEGDPWLGDFVGRGTGLWEWARTADPNHLIVVAGAVNYWVNACEPSRVHVFEDFFVRSIHPALGHGLLLLVGYSDIRALDGTGRSVWQAESLASDGFSEVRVALDVVVLRGYQAAAGTELETTLSLDDGRVVPQRAG